MIRCPRCDGENPLGVPFCRSCGGPLPTAPATSLVIPMSAMEREGEGPSGHPAAPPATIPADQDVEAEVLGLLQQGQKIQAIKVYRARQPDLSLREAKEAVETLAAKHGLAAAHRNGCLPVLMVSAAIVSGLSLVDGLAGPRDPSQGAEAEATATSDVTGVLKHTLRSEYQGAATELHVLPPDHWDPSRRYPVVYVLPVEAGTEDRWGDGLAEVQKHNLHNQYQAIFVAPTFSHLPWYADHPTNAAIRQETYFLKVVLPWIETHYPVEAGPAGRRLLGFSKSGYGAFSLLLRHPDLFGRAAAWDAPVSMAQPNRYGMGEIYGTQDNFERYRISTLLEQHAAEFREAPRLFLLGYGNFRDQHETAHAQMLKLGIAHHYEDGPQRVHHWSSGWVAPAVKLLLQADAAKRPAAGS